MFLFYQIADRRKWFSLCVCIGMKAFVTYMHCIYLDEIIKKATYVDLQGATCSGREPQNTIENCSHLLVDCENKEG